MALNYRSLSQADEIRLSVLQPGEYCFIVVGISQERSKGGTDKNGQQKKIYDMLVVDMVVVNENGRERKLRDWILLVEDEDTMGFKLRHFASTCGLIVKYESNTLEAKDFLGRQGTAKIGVKDYIDQHGEKKKQNMVIDYVKSIDLKNDQEFNDDIKF